MIFKGTSKNPHFIPTAALRKNFLLTYHIYAALRNFPRSLHLGELCIFRGALKGALKLDCCGTPL
jgi:hypothetical protein